MVVIMIGKGSLLKYMNLTLFIWDSYINSLTGNSAKNDYKLFTF